MMKGKNGGKKKRLKLTLTVTGQRATELKRIKAELAETR